MLETIDLKKELSAISGLKITENILFSNITTFKIGGTVRMLIQPSSIEALKELIVRTKRIKKYIIGNGSNLLMPDNGLDGIVIKIAKCLDSTLFNGDTVTANAGILTKDLMYKAKEHDLSGLEFVAGIPAALGGAIFMNMGAWGSEISSIIESIECLDSSGRSITLGKNDITFSYRNSGIKELLIVSAKLKLKRSSRTQIEAKIKDNLAQRKLKQPLEFPSAGSVFMNPVGHAAGRLIELAGFKGQTIGGAQVSTKHANFIINLGTAKESDVRALIEKIKRTIKENNDIELKTELIDSSHLNMIF